LRQAAVDFTTPPVRARAREVEATYKGVAVRLLAIQVESGDRVHETVTGECYLRVGDESKKLGFAQRQELEFDRGGAPFDGSQVSAILADVDTGAAGHTATFWVRRASRTCWPLAGS
jgi:ATP-dependent DNA helicase RecG